MPTYEEPPQGKVDYRKIYEKHHGPIPKDTEGRSYHIHHIDGNRDNNDISNLLAVSIQEHYEIHLEQGDWLACARLATALRLGSDEIRSLARKHAKKRIDEGNHNFIGDENPSRQRVLNGTHHFIGGDIARHSAKQRVVNGTHNFIGGAAVKRSNRERILNGTHHFLGGDIQRRRIDAGTHPFLGKRTCPHCGKEGQGASMLRWHFDRCKRR